MPEGEARLLRFRPGRRILGGYHNRCLRNFGRLPQQPEFPGEAPDALSQSMTTRLTFTDYDAYAEAVRDAAVTLRICAMEC